ncbi:hypothetical protein CoNPh17_CDS0012 [Staphylococcus phage S-CoN_Ph17]|nr:hypothetical protein CoNPh17_CDS0012 [Staphylococcus phage S-CoN_Ph17]
MTPLFSFFNLFFVIFSTISIRCSTPTTSKLLTKLRLTSAKSSVSPKPSISSCNSSGSASTA